MMNQHLRNILIIERQMIVATDLTLQLLKLGYCITGIRSWLTMPNDKKILEQSDIVFLSVDIYDELDGLILAESIKDSIEKPIIFFGNSLRKSGFDRMCAVDPFAFITKPFDSVTLRRGLDAAAQRMSVLDVNH